MFATADGCARCHSASPQSHAMRSAVGDDVSPHGLWQATVMANSFRDPYWQAQVARECEQAASDPDGRDPEDVAALCLRCHAPMRHHTLKNQAATAQPAAAAAAAAIAPSARAGTIPKADAAPALTQAEQDPLARDGVSCTVCHQIRARGLGEPTTWSGKGRIGRERVIYGPYPEPQAAPMRGMSGYAAVHGAHVQSSALCATCHTLVQTHSGQRFPEQTPYLEWRNSVYSDEKIDGRDADPENTRTCQQCHMVDVGAARIARSPDGLDFQLPLREPYRAHAFVGGNTFLLEMLRTHRDELGVAATDEALQRMVRATRHQLTTATAELAISEVRHVDDELRFQVEVRNLTGHKFPTGYPARRAWLQVRVANERGVVFEVGACDEDGEIQGVIDPFDQEHVQLIESRLDVPIWEMVAADADDEPTTSLSRMAKRKKDTRILPAGWRADGPHNAETRPVAATIDGKPDPDYYDGRGADRVDVVVPYDAGSPRATVSVWLHYQSIPPHWVEPLRWVEDARCERFVGFYDAADKTPETIASAQRAERL
ncbi:MAG: hypothetical protein AB8H80_04915 [Planctomycetota bacterium]